MNIKTEKNITALQETEEITDITTIKTEEKYIMMTNIETDVIMTILNIQMKKTIFGN